MERRIFLYVFLFSSNISMMKKKEEEKNMCRLIAFHKALQEVL